MEHKVVFSSDLHGNETQYAKLVDYAEREEAKTLIIGGDICPKGMRRTDYIRGQRDFLQNRFSQFFERLRLKRPQMNIFVIMGNDDVAVNMDILESSDPELYRVIHGLRLSINSEYDIIGYPYVPMTRASLKDWDKFDVEKYPARFKEAQRHREGEWKLNALRSGQYKELSLRGLTGYDFVESTLNPADAARDSIERDLASPIFTEQPEKTIYVMHAPPYGTHLDQANVGYPVGSVAERLFIEQYQPYLTLHGHIYETVQLSGDFRERIGRTVSLSSGNDPLRSHVALVTFDLAHPESAQRLII
ncbi:MAG: metallophosphoesterase [uncultured bacterium]|nr:MAG: metallophosphoesterase [uncultured bacterium]